MTATRTDRLAAMDAVPLAVIATDLDGTIKYVNAAAGALYGHVPASLIGSSVMELFVQPEHHDEAVDIMAAVLAGQVWSGEFHVPRSDGAIARVHVDDVPWWQDGQIVGVIGFSRPAGELTPDEVSARLGLLGQMISQLAGARTMNDVAAIVTRQAEAALGAATTSLCTLESGGMLRLVAMTGRHLELAERYRQFSVDEPNAISVAARTREPVVAVGRDELERRFPGIFPGSDERSVLALPLLVEDRCWGVVGFAFAGRRELTPEDDAFARTLAETTAQALERLAASASADAQARRLAFLADATNRLADSLDLRTTLTNVARLALDEFADWVVVELAGPNAGPVLTLHRDPAKVALAEQVRLRYPRDPAATSGVAAVLRSGIPELVESVAESMLVAAALDPDHLDLLRQLGLASVMIVPLTARGRVLGALTLVASEQGRYGRDDLALAVELAKRAAVAIDNSELYTQTLEASQRMQHAALPEALPDGGRWCVSAHYRPAGRTEVGGDFYDAVELADGRLVAVIGDVMGRGVGAAAAMAQVRAAVRAYVAVDPNPGSVIERMAGMFATYRTQDLVTVLVALVDPRTETATFATAGHPPPVLCAGADEPQLLELPPAPPLGAGVRQVPVRTVPFGSGDSFVCFTDGLVETRERDVDAGIAAVVGRLRDQPTTTPAELAQSLVVADLDDDVTVLRVTAR